MRAAYYIKMNRELLEEPGMIEATFHGKLALEGTIMLHTGKWE